LSPDGTLAVTAGQDKTAQLWDTKTGKPHRPPLKHDGPILAVAFTRDGKMLATASEDNTARLWNVADGKPIGDALSHGDAVLHRS
jgi:WD40 repeat protein